MTSPDEIRWAWFAGLFEGEGCIGFTGRNSVRLIIGMADQDVLVRCLEVTRVGSLRCDAHGLWRWYVDRAEDVLLVLDRIEPLLGERRAAKAREARERLSRVRREGHCRRGHPMEGLNLYVSPGGQRVCRACRRARDLVRKT